MAANGSDQVQRAERISFEAMVDGVRRAGAQFVGLLRSLDPADGARPVPTMTWTAAETAVHMFNIVCRGTNDMRRSDTMPGLAVLNDQCIAETETRNLHEIADAIEHELGRLTRGLNSMDGATAAAMPFPLHAGLTANVPSALSYVLFDFLAHGLDIARAAGREDEWQIDSALAELDLHACLPLLDPWVTNAARTGPSQRLAVSFPGDGDVIVVEVGGGSYHAQNEARDAVSDVDDLDPVEAFLAVAGRAVAPSCSAQRLAALFEPI